MPELPTEPFVFVTVGTDHHPFDRLVEACEEWARAAGFGYFIQTGASRPVDATHGAPYLPYPAMAEAMARARAVVSHGGPATIMLARQNRQIPLVVPRDPERGEHVDGHQQEFSRWMAARDQIVIAETTDELCRRLDIAVADENIYRIGTENDATQAAVATFSELVNDLIERRRRS
jgi:UDP-N-acetylglucosamine transferase subunit ALG13